MTLADTLHSPSDSYLGAQLSPRELECLNQLGSNRTLDSGSFLFHQHSHADHVYHVSSGMLMAERLSSNGKRQVIAFLLPGDFMGFTHNDFFEFSTVAVTKLELIAYPRRAFITLTDEIPTLKRNVAKISNQVLTRFMDQVFALGQKKAHERLCFLLQQIHERAPADRPDIVELAMSRQDIADYLGLTIETVSRALARLKKDGIITDVSAHQVTVVDAKALNRLASID